MSTTIWRKRLTFGQIHWSLKNLFVEITCVRVITQKTFILSYITVLLSVCYIFHWVTCRQLCIVCMICSKTCFVSVDYLHLCSFLYLCSLQAMLSGGCYVYSMSYCYHAMCQRRYSLIPFTLHEYWTDFDELWGK